MSAGWSATEFASIAQLVTARTGIDFQSRQDDVERAMRHAMARVGVTGVDEFARRLASDGRDWDELIDAITVKETYFYRHPEHFALVRDRILPALREQREDRMLRVWSAGCASGEEAYSLAMCLHEQGLLDSAVVHGTDLCQVALAKARVARYREWSLRGLDPALSKRYLRADEADTVVCDELRNKVTWSQLNLADDSYPSPLTQIWGMDLIFCRNVLIYFGPEASRRAERGLFDSLAEGGWLITGPCDPVLGSHAPFQMITTESGLVYRKAALHEARAAAAPGAWHGRARSELHAPTMPYHPGDDVVRAGAAAQREALVIAHAAIPADSRVDLLPSAASPSHDLAMQDAAAAAAAGVRARWKASGSALGMAACEAALALHPLSAELQYLRALALMDLGWHAESAEAVRRCLYLDRSLLIAHFTLGTLLERLRDADGARRAYRNVLEHCRAQPPDERVALGEGVTAAVLAEATTRALAQLRGCT